MKPTKRLTACTHVGKQVPRRPNKGFNMVMLGIALCAQAVGVVEAIQHDKWIVAGALVVLAACSVMVLRGLVRSKAS